MTHDDEATRPRDDESGRILDTETTRTVDDLPSGTWDKEQMRIDDAGADALPPRSGNERIASGDDLAGADALDRGRDAAGWNKGQLVFDDGADPQPRIDPDLMEDGEAGPTGRRADDGGGQRFGHTDNTEPSERV